MRSALWCALLCGIGMSAAAQQRTVTFEEPSPVSVTGFAVGRADYDRVVKSNTFTAGKIGVSLFKPVGDAYLFAQLTTALEDGESSTEIDNLIVSWTPRRANRWALAFGRFDAPIGFERDDEPLNLIPTNSFNFTFARPSKLTGVLVHYTASSRLELSAAAVNGWSVTVDNNRGKTADASSWAPRSTSAGSRKAAARLRGAERRRPHLCASPAASASRRGTTSWRTATACSRRRPRSCARSPSARCGTSRVHARESSATSSTRGFTSRRSRCAPPSGPTGRPHHSLPMPPGRCRARTPRACSSSSTCSRGGGGYPCCTTCDVRTSASSGS